MEQSRKDLWMSLYNEKLTSHLIDDELLALSMLFEITRVQFEEFKLKYAEEKMLRIKMESAFASRNEQENFPTEAISLCDNSDLESSVISVSPVLESKKSKLSMKLAHVRKKLLVNTPKRKKRRTKSIESTNTTNNPFDTNEKSSTFVPDKKDSTKVVAMEVIDNLDDTVYFMPSNTKKKDNPMSSALKNTTGVKENVDSFLKPNVDIFERRNVPENEKSVKDSSKTVVDVEDIREKEKDMYTKMIAEAQPKKPEFPYARDAVRKKADRMKMEGWDCFECKAYFSACDSNKENIKERMNKCSRHRYDFDPTTYTPAGYWDPIFTPTQLN